jgi:hypothetical protein
MDLSKNRVIKNWPFVTVLTLVVAQAIVNFIWLKKDNFPLWFDFGGYFKRSLEIYYASQNGLVDFIKAILGIGEYMRAYNPHRVILPLFSLPWYYIWGMTADAAVMSCTTFLAISLFSIYGIASRMFDKMTGFLAAFILSVSPGFFTFYRRYSPEFASTAMVALTAYFLLCSQNFRSRRYSVLSGIGLGLSMITKEMAFAFIFGIIIYSLYKAKFFSWFNPSNLKDAKVTLINFIIALFIAGVITVPIYLLHRQHIFQLLFHHAYSNTVRQLYNMPVPYSLEGITYYIRNLFNFSFLPLYSICFCLGVVLCLWRNLSNKGFLFFWLIGSYIMLSSIQTRAWYYGIPLLIPISIITAYGINSVFKNKISQILLISIVITWGILNFLVYSFPIFGSSHRHILNPDGYSNYLYPVKEDWKLDEIIDYVKENLAGDNTLLIHAGANLPAFSPMTLAYVATQKKIKTEFAGCQLKTEEALSCDFVIAKSGQNQGMFYSAMQARELIQALDKNEFVKLPKTFILPDGSKVTIYKNRAYSK